LTHLSGEPILLDQSYEQEPALQKRGFLLINIVVMGWKSEFIEKATKALGKIDQDFPLESCWVEECMILNFLTDGLYGLWLILQRF
jgi:hypothetical protein